MSKRAQPVRQSQISGVTLIELVITIALAAILVALIVNFVQPVRSYIDSSRRAALADTADTALRRIGRDVHLALPNSVRVDGTAKLLEFMLVRTGGRYRSEADAADTTSTCPTGAGSTAAENVLTIGAADTCFKTLGDVPNISQVVVGAAPTDGDFLVVFNLQPGTANADAYAFSGTGGNKSKITAAADGAGSERIQFDSNTFVNESPGKRFFIVEGPVSYVCDTTAKTLTRYWNYNIASAQPTTFATGSSALLASGVTGCSFTYDTSVTSQGAGLVTLELTLTTQDSRGTNESVTLYHSTHVNNVP